MRRIYVFHFRSYEQPVERGGITVVYNTQNCIMSAAVCSKKDNYNRKFGKNLALIRTLTSCHPEWILYLNSTDYEHIKYTAKMFATKLADQYKLLIDTGMSEPSFLV